MTTKPRELISRAEYARRKNVAARTIGKYTQRGIIPLHDNMIDPVEADLCLDKVLAVPLGSGRHANNTGKKPVDVTDPDKVAPEYATDTYTAARTAEKRLKVELLELDLQLKKGEMVLTKDVEFAAYTAARQLRDRMLNIPDRVAAIIAAETDEVKIRDILTDHIESEIRSIAKDSFNSEE